MPDTPAVKELMEIEALRQNNLAPSREFDFEKYPSMGEVDQDVFYVEPSLNYVEQILS